VNLSFFPGVHPNFVKLVENIMVVRFDYIFLPQSLPLLHASPPPHQINQIRTQGKQSSLG